MSTRDETIRLLLLDMLAGERDAGCATMRQLAACEWRMLAGMARQHRLEPLLRRNLEASPHWPVPEEIGRQWRAAFRESTFRALAAERVIRRIAACFDAARIPYAALKGAWLAFHAYPHPALRPLRDIDVLVPFSHAGAAYALLLSQGFIPRSRAEPSADHALSHGKHLPGLVSPDDAVSVEIHHRLLTPDPRRDRQALAADHVLESRIATETRAGCVTYPAPAEMLLHLIVHALYEHGLCNGPLVLADIACLLDTTDVDWDRFWAMAEQGGWRDGCRLMLGLAGHYHAVRSPQPVRHAALPDAVLRTAALLMLQDHAQRGRIELVASLGATPGILAKLRLAAGRAWPRRHALAAFAGQASNGRFTRLHYPAWLASRLWLAAGALMAEPQRADMRRARALRSWLAASE